MNILLIGSGGREHSLALALSQSPRLTNLYIAPGNPGTAECGSNVPISDSDTQGLLAFAKDKNIALTFVGPEAPLVAGIVTLFQENGLTIVGPDQLAARLEGSKVWAKSFMQRHNIPTAAYASFNDYNAAKNYLLEQNTYPIVIKADGLAAGKGVTVAANESEAFKALEECFLDNRFGAAGANVVIEAFLKGEESSVLAFTDGKTIVPMLAAQDHKAVYDNDKGPNTGGMGAYCPAPIVTPDMVPIIQKTILEPIIAGMAAEGMQYKGILYAGLMITADGPFVVEYNVRFGDPETQVVLPLLKTDLIDIFMAIAETRLDSLPIEWHNGSCICVVMASGGYPGAMETGFPITGIAEAEATGLSVIQAGTKLTDGQLVSSGGRVLGIVSRQDNLQKAIDAAYANIEKVHFKGVHYRHDIGQKALPK
jgi:phosphoribosylamine---glycine ligase